MIKETEEKTEFSKFLLETIFDSENAGKNAKVLKYRNVKKIPKSVTDQLA